MELQVALAVAVAVTVIIAVILLLVVLALGRKIASLRAKLKELQSRKQSQATRHGQMAEQFMPFMADWPWDAKDFRFIGSPIDGIQFTPDEVILVEIKTGKSTLNSRQRAIRQLVESGRIRWQEVRI